jgi:hypothetical protein
MAIAITRDNYIEELLTPAPDGTTIDFQTSVPYDAVTLGLWYDGMLLVAESARGYTKLGGTVIRFDRAPRAGSTLEVRYNPS